MSRLDVGNLDRTLRILLGQILVALAAVGTIASGVSSASFPSSPASASDMSRVQAGGALRAVLTRARCSIV